jgi:2-amino-4-hydroxy-6-hydroxymethyldihydropteridine diphosphokinase
VVKVALHPPLAAANKAPSPTTMVAPRQPVTAYVALGANLGDAAQTVRDALAALGTLPDTQLVKASSLYRTAPIASSGPDYINAVAEISTKLTAPDLLRALQGIELSAGRERPYRNAPRTLDLDVLLYGAARIASAQLTVPHARMWERAFVLVPLSAIASNRVSLAQLAAVKDQKIHLVGA